VPETWSRPEASSVGARLIEVGEEGAGKEVWEQRSDIGSVRGREEG
jgi:hypothetical protein